MSITTILTLYRRPEYLAHQIEAVRNQTVKSDIWLWINHCPETNPQLLPQLNVDRVIHNSYNFNVFGRFAASLLAETDYVALFDDDTIPGPKWFQNCLTLMEEEPRIIGSNGVTLTRKGYHEGYPVNNPRHPHKETTEVDLVGHAWFFKQDWAKYMWMEKPYSLTNGEDMHFSCMCKKQGIKTVVPAYTEDKDYWGSTQDELGLDSKAMSWLADHGPVREQSAINLIEGGWNTVRGIT